MLPIFVLLSSALAEENNSQLELKDFSQKVASAIESGEYKKLAVLYDDPDPSSAFHELNKKRIQPMLGKKVESAMPVSNVSRYQDPVRLGNTLWFSTQDPDGQIQVALEGRGSFNLDFSMTETGPSLVSRHPKKLSEEPVTFPCKVLINPIDPMTMNLEIVVHGTIVGHNLIRKTSQEDGSSLMLMLQLEDLSKVDITSQTNGEVNVLIEWKNEKVVDKKLRLNAGAEETIAVSD